MFYNELKSKSRGFTLIELLAVIIILGVLMIIAIPSVTKYIQDSRKESYVTIAQEYISGARNIVNSGEMKLYDPEVTYYIPSTCISLERGGDSPFGEFDPAYVVVTYTGNNYDYYFTGRDTSSMGIYLTYEGLLDKDSVKSGVKNVDTTIGVGERESIIRVTDSCTLEDVEEYLATSNIDDKGLLESNVENNPDDSDKGISLYNKIIEQNKENGEMVLDNASSTYVSASTGIDFNKAPSNTNGKGLYVRAETENDKYPIYYYRGAVTNNNVIFGGFCWKIVRTTETGGIKLIYNGITTNGTCNNTGEASQIGKSEFNTSYEYNAYVGYMYGTPNSSSYSAEHLSTKTSTSSTIKTAIDTWYSNNMTSYTSYLEDTIWCNDRSFASNNKGTGSGTSETWYGADGRVGYEAESNPQPSLECVNQNDRFTVNETMEGRVNGNAALTYPVALLTADELTLAGQGYRGYSTTNYLYTGQDWWSLSPSAFSGYAFEFYVSLVSYLYDNRVYYSHGVRPSVSLKLGTEISEDGDGSVNNPFVVKIVEKQ